MGGAATAAGGLLVSLAPIIIAAGILIGAYLLLTTSNEDLTEKFGENADILIMDREPLDYRAFVQQAYVNGRLAYDKSKSTIWSHIRTDRSAGMGPWQRYGIWFEWPDGIKRVTRTPQTDITLGTPPNPKPKVPATGNGDGPKAPKPPKKKTGDK